jgi:anti-anti-sigma factor
VWDSHDSLPAGSEYNAALEFFCEGAAVDIHLEHCVGVVVLRFAGDMRLWGRPEEKNRLLETFQSGLQGRRSPLVLSLRDLKFVDTMGISALVNLLKRCAAQGLNVRAVLPVGVAGQALRAIRIFERYPEFPDEQAAIRASEEDSLLTARPEPIT